MASVHKHKMAARNSMLGDLISTCWEVTWILSTIVLNLRHLSFERKLLFLVCRNLPRARPNHFLFGLFDVNAKEPTWSWIAHAVLLLLSVSSISVVCAQTS